MKVTTKDRGVSDPRKEWRSLLDPGVCWLVKDQENYPSFCTNLNSDISYFNNNYRSFEEIFPPDIAFLLKEIIRNALDLLPGQIKPVILVIPGNESGWIGHIFRIINEGFILTWSETDTTLISYKKEDYEAITRSESAIKKANEKLNYFNAIVRYDIINLVVGITGYLDIIEEIIDKDESGLLIRKCRALGDRIKRVAELTRSYQDLGIRPPYFQDISLIVNKVISRHEFFGKIKADVRLDNLFLYVDRLIDEVIYELIRNSLQYGGADVKMRFSYMVNNDGLKLIIEDSGPGISPDLKDIIFSREYTARKGYGLYLASEILDITNITIRETGIFGSGARFELFFPADTYYLN